VRQQGAAAGHHEVTCCALEASGVGRMLKRRVGDLGGDQLGKRRGMVFCRHGVLRRLPVIDPT